MRKIIIFPVGTPAAWMIVIAVLACRILAQMLFFVWVTLTEHKWFTLAECRVPQVCYVIFVAESDVARHFLSNRKGVWVRTDEFSARFDHQLADENELKHLLDRRRLVRERRLRLV